MNAPADADRTSFVETSKPLTDDLISQIMDLLSLVGRKHDVVAAEYQETRFRARLSEDKTFRPCSPEPRIENLRGGKSPSEIRQLRMRIISSKTQLQTQMQNLKLNQATLDLLKEELPSEGVAMLDSLQLLEANGNLPLREDLEIDSIFGQVKDKILKILVLQQNLKIGVLTRRLREDLNCKLNF